MAKNEGNIIIRRVKKVAGHGHHGGAWKVAYADFVTAMMAFFLVMWLVGSTTNKQRAAISEYFKNPSAVPGKSVSPTAGPNGPGGASNSMIKLGGTMEIPRGPGDSQLNKEQPKADSLTPQTEAQKAVAAAAEAKKEQNRREMRSLQSLLDELHAAIEKSQALEPFKDQLLLDITPLGLRIQIVDKKARPMFDLGSAVLKPYTTAILHELSKFIDEVPNNISITGHTDLAPYSNEGGYTNWELSADRANAARRALIVGGMAPSKIRVVVGLASSVLFDKDDPYDPINRRISILVMTSQSEKAMLEPNGIGVPLTSSEPEPSASAHDGAPPDTQATTADGAANDSTGSAAPGSETTHAPAASASH